MEEEVIEAEVAEEQEVRWKQRFKNFNKAFGRLSDAETTRLQIPYAIVYSEFQFIAFDDRQYNPFALFPFFDELVCLHFVGKRVIEQYGLRPFEARMVFQLLQQAGRPF